MPIDRDAPTGGKGGHQSKAPAALVVPASQAIPRGRLRALAVDLDAHGRATSRRPGRLEPWGMHDRVGDQLAGQQHGHFDQGVNPPRWPVACRGPVKRDRGRRAAELTGSRPVRNLAADADSPGRPRHGPPEGYRRRLTLLAVARPEQDGVVDGLPDHPPAVVALHRYREGMCSPTAARPGTPPWEGRRRAKVLVRLTRRLIGDPAFYRSCATVRGEAMRS